MGHSLISSEKRLGSPTSTSTINKLEQQKIDEIMKKDRLANTESQKVAPPVKSKSKIQKEKREKKAATAGKEWHHLSKPVLTDELKQELKVLNMRQFIDPKKFYKKSSLEPEEYFEVGTVVSHAKDYYTAPNRKVKGRKEDLNFVEDLLHDREYKKYAKRKYKEILEKKQRSNKRRKPT